MAKQIRNLFERCSGIDQPSAQGVSQYMDSSVVPSESLVSAVQGALNGTAADGLTNRCFDAHKQLPARGLGSLVAEIVDDRLARGLRQRQKISASGLAGRNSDGPRLPINVIEAEPDDLAGSQSEIDEAANDRIGTSWRVASFESPQ